MGHRLGFVAVLAALSLLVATPAGAERAQVRGLRLLLDGDFSPHSLPRQRQVPVTVRFDGAISTVDGSHPPALRRFEIALNRNGSFSPAGLPTCRASMLQSSGSGEALRRCRAARVGGGSFRAEIDSQRGAVTARGRLLAFNSRRGGRPALLLHLYAATPIEAAYVLPLTIRRQPRGAFGTVLAARLPDLLHGRGSITDIHLRLGRSFHRDGRRRSLIEASCAAPAGFSIALFPFARASFRFADGTRAKVPLTRSCRVR